jgi:hypothetical protein
MPEGSERRTPPAGRPGKSAPGTAPSARVGRTRVCVALVAAFCILAICAGLNDWLIAPFLSILAALFWHTRADPFATQPGFVIGFLAGAVLSGGIGPADEISTGLLCGTIVAPLNAIFRGFRRGGAAALLGILGLFGGLQLIPLAVFH